MKRAVVGIGLAILLSGAMPSDAQWLKTKTPGIPRTKDGAPHLTAPAPRTTDGKPDLSGLWQRISLKYERNIAADLKPGEIQPWAQTLVRQRAEDHCIHDAEDGGVRADAERECQQ